MTEVAEETAPEGRPMVGPFDRAAWREWLIANHASSKGVYLVSWRRASGKSSVPYEEAVEEALCVGWVDATGRTLDDERGLQWFAPRRPKSGWARSNKERVARLEAAGLMLPAGLAAIDEAKRNGMWTLLDDVEKLVVPDDLAAALAGAPPAAENWEGFSRSARRAMLEWIVQARRPDTREKRISAIAEAAARGERAYPPASD
ncbi:MAG: YdeI/OmpD-associated family protein [Chloroflexota bacterium]